MRELDWKKDPADPEENRDDPIIEDPPDRSDPDSKSELPVPDENSDCPRNEEPFVTASVDCWKNDDPFDTSEPVCWNMEPPDPEENRDDPMIEDPPDNSDPDWKNELPASVENRDDPATDDPPLEKEPDWNIPAPDENDDCDWENPRSPMLIEVCEKLSAITGTETTRMVNTATANP